VTGAEGGIDRCRGLASIHPTRIIRSGSSWEEMTEVGRYRNTDELKVMKFSILKNYRESRIHCKIALATKGFKTVFTPFS